MSNFGSKHSGILDHRIAEYRAMKALGWSYWSRIWHVWRERANDPQRSIQARQTALWQLNVAAKALQTLEEGGPTPIDLGHAEL